MQAPQPGQVYERDGRTRKVLRLEPTGTGSFYVWFCTDSLPEESRHLRAWKSWAKRATLLPPPQQETKA